MEWNTFMNVAYCLRAIVKQMKSMTTFSTNFLAMLMIYGLVTKLSIQTQKHLLPILIPLRFFTAQYHLAFLRLISDLKLVAPSLCYTTCTQTGEFAMG